MKSYDRGETSSSLLEETIGANLERSVERYGGSEALVECATGRRWTYREFGRDVDAVARGLIGSGIEAGDRVGIWAPNCAEWVLVQYAAAKIGAVLVNINPAYRPSELAYALNQSGVRLLVCATAFKSSDYRQMLGEVRSDITELERVVFLGTSDWDELLSAGVSLPGAAVPERMATLDPHDPINIQYTSGTTGFPKGATLSHRNILNNGHFTTEAIGLTTADRLCVPVPFYHCFGMVMANLGCTSHGATIVIPAPGFDAALTLQAVEDERCTALYGVPTMFIAMLDTPNFGGYDLTSLRTGIMAGSPCPVEVMKRCISDMHMEEVSIAYGMTETSPVSTQTGRDDIVDLRTSTIGRVHPHLEIKIIDPDTGETVSRGEPGELCTRGYSVMLGYWEDPGKTAGAIDVDGWMHTGDLAVMREDGYCTIVGRIKDMVIRGGENIYPREVEEFLHTHPDILDAQVVGVPDPKYGEELCAWIQMRDGAAPLDADAIRAFASGKLAHYKIPRFVFAVDEFPLTVTGKVRKVEMRTESAHRLGLTQPETISETAGFTSAGREQTISTVQARRDVLRDAVDGANIPTLLMLVFQATGDHRWLEDPYRPTRGKGLGDHDTGGLPDDIQAEIRAAAVDALIDLEEGKPLAVPEPSVDLTLEMMSVFMGEPIPEHYGPMITEELARFSGTPRDGFEDVDLPPDFDVIVVGLGLAGTVAAKHLKEMGVPFTIIEKNEANGGNWLLNQYPGAGVDTPSHLYSFSFAHNDWPLHFTLRDDLLPYFDRVIDELGVDDRIRYGTQVQSAVWNEDTEDWRVTVRNPDGTEETLRSRIVITAVGVLNEARIPDVPGLNSFTGTQIHPSRWPDDLDLTGKNVAVVGTGASAMQIVPAITDQVKHLTVVQRTPQWVAPFEKFRQEISPETRHLLAEVPVYHSWYWLRLFWQFGDKVIDALRRDPEWPHPERAMNARNDAHRKLFTRYIEEQLGDRQDLLPAVLPEYPPFGKRILLDNGWYKALRKPNVTLIPEGVASVTSEGLVTQGGHTVDADVIVWSTGYQANRFLASFDVRGKGGQSIREAWDDDDPRAYLGVCTPGFPNLFMLGGPQSFPGSGSFMFFMEVQMRYLRRLLTEVMKQRISTIEVRADITEEYSNRVDELHNQTVWTHPGMQTYFRNSKGRISFVMPFLNVEYWNMVRHASLEPFHVTTTSGSDPDGSDPDGAAPGKA